MSDNSYLTIGDLVFTWRYQVPTFVTFLFKEEDIRIEREDPLPGFPDEEPEEVDPDELALTEAGFRTTVAAAKEVLDEYGYTVEFFADIYASFHDELDHRVREVLGDEIGQHADCALSDEQIDERVREHTAASSSVPLDDLVAFTAFLREAIETDLQMEPFLEEVALGQTGGQMPAREYLRHRGRGDLADFESLQMLVIDRADRVPAGVLRPLVLFDEGYVFVYPEVISLLYTRLVLDATPDDAVVELDVRQVVETEAAVRALHVDLAYELLHKVDVYQRVFRALSEREEDVQDRYARNQVRNGLSDLAISRDAQAKGEALEQLMAAVFSIKPQLQVVQRTYSTGDEEIDLIVKNNVSRPFWQGLASPLIFVECKNWIARVGATEVRNFEVKLQNHTPMTRVGILVAPGGFTTEAVNAIKRASRDPYMIALVTGEDLDELARGATSVLDWLEQMLCKPV
jgi:Restriction endonuclease